MSDNDWQCYRSGRRGNKSWWLTGVLGAQTRLSLEAAWVRSGQWLALTVAMEERPWGCCDGWQEAPRRGRVADGVEVRG